MTNFCFHDKFSSQFSFGSKLFHFHDRATNPRKKFLIAYLAPIQFKMNTVYAKKLKAFYFKLLGFVTEKGMMVVSKF